MNNHRHYLAAALVAISTAFALSHPAAAQSFVHPGGLHSKADLDRMKTKVAAGEHPWIDGWTLFIKDPKAQDNYKARPAADMGSRQRAQDDATAMYYNALRWYISGEKSNAECAVRIANDWASTVHEKPYGDDLSGIPIGSFALAAEVLRVYPGWAKGDFDKFKEMMVKYWYPKSSDFLKNHGNGPVSRSWANWDACNMLAVLGIGVLCDDRPKFHEAVEYFKNGPGMGSIRNAVPFLYPDGLGQWQESGRDWAHTMGGQGLLSEFCQVAWNQNLDLFGYDDNRLLKGGEYAAQYTLWKSVPFTYYTNADNANQSYVSTNYKGRLAATHFELLYNHYVVRKGLKAPNVKLFAEMKRPEPGEIDIFGYGTLTFTLDAAASPTVSSVPPVPLDLTAVAGIGRVELKWSPSGAYMAQGYEVSRATNSGGPYTSIYSTTNFTTPLYTDTKVSGGTTYYYVVAAVNQVGTSSPSPQTSATPVAGGSLPQEWKHETIGNAAPSGEITFDQAANKSFVVPGAGRSIGGTADDCNFVYRAVDGDFTITARLSERNGDISMCGLMMRESAAPDAEMLALTLGEVGGRQARFRTRSSTGEKTSTQLGNDYTWIPIWFRLQRAGNVFTAFQSPDCIEWFTIGSSTVPMSKNYFVGLAANTSGKADSPPGSVMFDNVAAEIRVPSPPAAPANLRAAAPGDKTVRLVWKNSSGNEAGFKVEAASGGETQFHEISDLGPDATGFTNTGLRDPGSYRYRVRAYNRGGCSSYSNIATITAGSR
ncbi:MAG: alginate lyase family protein [Luteolibacter sp.]|uniref:alginate lyase family protein n=1 Tax=Luteolibacter sp. TaxID=1962973 RepID=UPI0032671B8F